MGKAFLGASQSSGVRGEMKFIAQFVVVLVLSLFLFLGCAMAVPNIPAGFAAQQFKTSDNARLHYYDSGKPGSEDTTVLFVPGWTIPGWIWFEQAKLVAPLARVVVLDPRGQGASPVASSGYEYPRRARDIAETIAACQCKKVVLVGWSLGGLESLQYAHDFASAGLSALVLVDHSVGTGTAPKWDPTFLPRVRSAQRKTMTQFVKGMFRTKPSSAWLDSLVDASMQLPSDLSVKLLSQPTPREFWRDAFLNAPVPVMYSVVPRFSEQAQIMKQAKPSIRTSIYELAGHALFIDESARFNAELVAFIQDLSDYKAPQMPVKAK
jgi:non-heme chloroperoxidase